MIALTNKNGVIIPLAYRKNVGEGRIVGESNLEVFYNIEGEIIKLPKKNNMILNLDFLTFSQTYAFNSVLDIPLKLKANDTSVSVLGVKSQEKPNNAYSVDASLKEWNIRNRTKTNFNFDSSMTSNNKLTLSITAKVESTTSWEDLILFLTGNSLRIEWNNTSYQVFPAPNSGNLISPTIDRTKFFNLTFTMQDNVFNFYQNGVKFGENITFSGDVIGSPNKVYICTRRDEQACGNYVIKTFRIWKDALSDDEVVNICKIDGIIS